MSTNDIMRARLKHNRPSLRRYARPPKQRTTLGQAFTAANLADALVLQHCGDCGQVQYPSREVCCACLCGDLVWRSVSGRGQIVSQVNVQHSLWEYFKRRTASAPWPIASVKLESDVIVFAHVDPDLLKESERGYLKAGTSVSVFSHTDSSLNSVLIATAGSNCVDEAATRLAIAERMGLTGPAERPEGI